MFSTTISADIITMRPGPVAGHYPQRKDLQEPLRLPDAIFGIAACLLPEACSDLQKVALMVEQEGRKLTGLTETELKGIVRALRQEFSRSGFDTRLCVRSFALVREFSSRTIGLRHYDTQVMAAWTLVKGMVAEMATGEGKTLAATLAAATAALAGIPVHVITVNEYLAQRDARIMQPLYGALGIRTGCVTSSMSEQERRAEWACDITYCTNKQAAFDYLRDRLLMGAEAGGLRFQMESAYRKESRMSQLLMRGLCFAIIDEADSVLADDARTPLILTRKIDSQDDNGLFIHALRVAEKLGEGEDFIVDFKARKVLLTEIGQKRLHHIYADTMPSHRGQWHNAMGCEELVCMALHAVHILEKDRDYIVSDNRVLIIDSNTGRTMPDRSWERGLQQLVEAMEGCPVTGATEQLGRLTYQQFFRRYMRLSGMSGTVREIRNELWSVYGLGVRKIPLHLPCRRTSLPVRIYPSEDEKWAAVTASIRELHSAGRPVLIGTGSVSDSERLSRILGAQGIAHNVLNARQDRQEAEIIASAGRLRQVTVATNMAGRGTDIKISADVAALGGLHVILACCNQARRIDRQLYGRCARQGDPGTCQVMISLDDMLIRQHCPGYIISILKRLLKTEIPFGQALARMASSMVQRRIERRHRIMRKALVKQEGANSRLLGFSGELE